MRRRASQGSGSLTSLLDVLFIIVFASLVQSTARGEERVVTAEEAAAAAAEKDAEKEQQAVAPAAPAALAALREAAVSATTRHVETAPLVAVRVSAGGSIVDVEWAGERRALGLPLLERVPDPDIAVAYLGDRAPALRLCGVVAHELRVADLTGHVVVISPAVPLGELSVALVAGLRRDVTRCQIEQQAMAVIVEPQMIAPPAPVAPPPAGGGTP